MFMHENKRVDHIQKFTTCILDAGAGTVSMEEQQINPEIFKILNLFDLLLSTQTPGLSSDFLSDSQNSHPKYPISSKVKSNCNK